MKRFTLGLLVLVSVVVIFALFPARALMGNHENAPPNRGLTALEERVDELESRVASLEAQIDGLSEDLDSEESARADGDAALQTQIDDIRARLPSASDISLMVSNTRTGPGMNVRVFGTVFDQFGSELPGAVVEFEASDGSIADSATTDANGEFEATYTTPEAFNTTSTITARSNGVVEQVAVETSGTPASVAGFNATNCDSVSCFFVTVTVADEDGRAVIGAEVEVHESADVRTFTGTTNLNGQMNFSLVGQDGLNVVSNTVTVTVRQLGTEIEQTITISS